ncbi:predicted protein [Sclerotinia sclerotiorum 1980 UF-70]|uniref:Uncharacterized protein n=1 Tax=Sclerotinia sclerotiorum (strain ATCC 18683 / 1980 / Ss-1) TaxID=665079 RepID=A7F2S0_SCLS1|nr:predicted protein [Sclerotinia sclerotiorum 1980 UF-70]EDN96012.1 predicted protein [Sclerotinia sclerotiorum 1980 UF-70]
MPRNWDWWERVGKRKREGIGGGGCTKMNADPDVKAALVKSAHVHVGIFLGFAV